MNWWEVAAFRGQAKGLQEFVPLQEPGFSLLSLGQAGESEADFGSSAIRSLPCSQPSVPCLSLISGQGSRTGGAWLSLLRQGMGRGSCCLCGWWEEQPARDPGTALEMVLLGCVLFSFCPSSWRQWVTDLSFTHSKKYLYSSVFFKSQGCWLKPYLRIFPSENWNFPHVRIGVSSFWQYCSLVSTNLKEKYIEVLSCGSTGQWVALCFNSYILGALSYLGFFNTF